MRLRMIGMAVVAAGLIWLTCANALAATPRPSGPSAASTESLLPSVNSLRSAELAPFSVDAVESLKDADAGSHPIHLALATPLTRERTFTRLEPTGATAAFGVPASEQPRRTWLMVSVIVLLIGYQLRRKHRLLRPHRFHRI